MAGIIFGEGMIKKGDIIRFIRNDFNDQLMTKNENINYNTVYKVVYVSESKNDEDNFVTIIVNGKNMVFYTSRFEKVSRKEKLERILNNGTS